MAIYRNDEDIICAISTPPGRGGIAVIRVSGPDSRHTARSAIPFLPAEPESHRIYFGYFKDPATNEAVDEVLVSFFADGRSFTGQETLEISYHGNPTLGSRILQILISLGARMAEPGEFTYRAFINGKIDLVQAEAVLALIESRSEKAAREALHQLQGNASKQVAHIEDRLTFVMANLEANLDFSAEDIVVAENDLLIGEMQKILDSTRSLLSGYRRGRILKSGFRVAIVGAPNVGKSSLLNAVLGEDRAIVTEIPGTTRDIVAGEISVAGVNVQFLDTAGIRTTEDRVEMAGIEKSKKLLAEADLVWVVNDASTTAAASESFDFSVLDDCDYEIILNKADLLLDQTKTQEENPEAILVSAKSGAGVETLLKKLESQLEQETSETAPALMQARQMELLQRAEAATTKGLGLLVEGASPEFVLAEIQDALLAVMNITGKQFDDEVMDRVFREFCLGK